MHSNRWLIAILGHFLVLQKIQACNEAVCASVVSKCLLTRECMCEGSSPTCRVKCLKCLSLHAKECCSCVDMCTYPAEIVAPKTPSHTERLEPNPELYNVLTKYPDATKIWGSFSYQIKIIQYGKNKKNKLIAKQNCTVAFMSTCFTKNMCKARCQTMGASGYRWFHNGCCECVGEHCVNYGINNSNRCRKCPEDGKTRN